MSKRFVSIWFRYLITDWHSRRQPELREAPFVVAASRHGRMVVMAADPLAQQDGIDVGMSVADARALVTGLRVLEEKPGLSEKLLKGLAEWFIRFTPVVAIYPPCGLILDATGCAHLWGDEAKYLRDISSRLKNFGYSISLAMADTVGAAWAVARYSPATPVIETGMHTAALLSLPAAALRLDNETTERLYKLGLLQISSFIHMQRPALRRRFGTHLLLRLNQALGHEEEAVIPVLPQEPYKEWLPCMEPIVTATGIEIALHNLLGNLCSRLQQEEKGLRICMLQCFRLDGRIEQIGISTNHPSSNAKHLFKLFESKIDTIEPDLGIELFTLEASKVEASPSSQEKLWKDSGGLTDIGVAELLDRVAGKIGENQIHRYVPAEHYWPERSYKEALLFEKAGEWISRQRPIQLLAKPAVITVTAPVPDYPPMMFRYKGKLHKVIKADGPERIGQEWWLQEGEHRDYYIVEDEEGHRYWIFRSGHYDAAKTYQWFIHGFFA